MDSINAALDEYEMSWSDMEILFNITSQSFVIASDGTYRFNSDIAISLGATPEQANNLNKGYQIISFDDVNNLKEEEFIITDPKANMMFAIAIPFLLNALIALGLAWLVTEILNLGAYGACKKWKNSSKAPRIFKAFCDSKGW